MTEIELFDAMIKQDRIDREKLTRNICRWCEEYHESAYCPAFVDDNSGEEE